MAQPAAATSPLAHRPEGTVYLVLDDFGELGRAYRETDAAQADLKTVVADLLSSPISCLVNIDIPCAWWPSTPPRAGRAMSAQTSRADLSLALASCMNCQLRYAISWSGYVRERPHDVWAALKSSFKDTPVLAIGPSRKGISVA